MLQKQVNLMKIKRFQSISVAMALGMLCGNGYGVPPTSFYRPYDADFMVKRYADHQWRVGVLTEYGQTRTAKNEDDDARNVLQIYTPTQSTIASLLNAAPASSKYQLLTSIFGDVSQATIDGRRGEIALEGSYRELDTSWWCSYEIPFDQIPGHWIVSCYVPVIYKALRRITFADMTRGVDYADFGTQEFITSDLARFLDVYGEGLHLDGYEKTGLGDITLMLSWYMDFKQAREHLKNVRFMARIGAMLPTGLRSDVNNPLMLPFGNDGAWGVPINATLTLDFVHRIFCGLDVDFLGVFNTTRTYRLSTHTAQTDYMVLHKGRATYVQGPMWRFSLFLGARDIARTGFNVMSMYQFGKHDSDRLYPETDDFNYETVNSMQRLERWSYHTLTFRIGYDGCLGNAREQTVIPQFYIFYKIPFIGQRIISADTFGLQASLTF